MRLKRTVCLIAVALLCLAPSLAFGQQSDENTVEKKKVRVVVKTSACEGDDCAEDGHRSVWVDDSKKVHVIGEGRDKAFFSESGGELPFGNHFVFRSGGGGLFELAGGGFLGVQLTELTDALRGHFGVRPGVGVMVGDVVDDSPAQRAGFRAGDIVVAVDGTEIGSGSELTKMVRALEDGETAGFEIMREGSSVALNATIVEREPRARFFSADGGQSQVPKELFFHRQECEDGEDCSAEGVFEKVIKIDGMHGGHDDMKVLHLNGLDLKSLECAGDGACEIMVECENDECECTVDGDTVPCSDLEQ